MSGPMRTTLPSHEMSIFDRLRGGNSDPDLSPQAGLLLAAITMIAADGNIDDDEMAIVRRLDGPEDTKEFQAAVTMWRRHDFDTCARCAVRALSTPEQRHSTLANLVDIAMADGFLAGEEAELLETYMTLLNVSDTDAKRIVDVIAVKNNRSLFR